MANVAIIILTVLVFLLFLYIAYQGKTIKRLTETISFLKAVDVSNEEYNRIRHNRRDLTWLNGKGSEQP